MRIGALAFIFVLLCCASAAQAEWTPLASDTLTEADLHFFFESISYDRGKWRFELSRNSMGMLWRTIHGKEDLTGVCSYKQTLVVSASASLEVKNKDIAILFRPYNPRDPVGKATARYMVWKRTGAASRSYGQDVCASVLETRDDSGFVFWPRD